MILNELLKRIRTTKVVGSTDVEIDDVNIDSRSIAVGHMFIAIKGTVTDGHKYIDKAVAQGAAAVVCEDMPDSLAEGVTYVQVPSTIEVAGVLATTFQNNPSEKYQ